MKILDKVKRLKTFFASKTKKNINNNEKIGKKITIKTILIAKNNSILDINKLPKPAEDKDEANLIETEEAWIIAAELPPPTTAKNHCKLGLTPSREIALNKVPAAIALGVENTSKR